MKSLFIILFIILKNGYCMEDPLSEIFSSSSKSNEDKSGSGEGPSEIPAEVPPIHPLYFNYSIEQLEPGTNTWIEACQIIKELFKNVMEINCLLEEQELLNKFKKNYDGFIQMNPDDNKNKYILLLINKKPAIFCIRCGIYFEIVKGGEVDLHLHYKENHKLMEGEPIVMSEESLRRAKNFQNKMHPWLTIIQNTGIYVCEKCKVADPRGKFTLHLKSSRHKQYEQSNVYEHMLNKTFENAYKYYEYCYDKILDKDEELTRLTLPISGRPMGGITIKEPTQDTSQQQQPLFPYIDPSEYQPAGKEEDELTRLALSMSSPRGRPIGGIRINEPTQDTSQQQQSPRRRSGQGSSSSSNKRGRKKVGKGGPKN